MNSDEPLDLYMVYLYPNPDGKYLGDSELPFMFEFYANDARHAMEQYMDDECLLSSEIDIARVEIKQVDPFYNHEGYDAYQAEKLNRNLDKAEEFARRANEQLDGWNE